MRLGQRRDLSGQRYGLLVVIGEHHRNEKGVYYWSCQCDCGNTSIVSGNNLRSGNIKSCGCLAAKCKPPKIIKHGMSGTKLHSIWISMKQRCTNPNDANYARYGGRGITVCDEWAHSFEAFRDWALSNGYVAGKVDLDREDNDKGYSPDNCRFISHLDNLRNTHRKLHDVIRGEDITLSEAAEKYGMRYQVIYRRYKSGKRGDELVEPCGN